VDVTSQGAKLEIVLSKNTPRAWQRMLSGRRLDLLDPSPMDIEIEDIAHGLSFVARWNGQTHGEYPYSVAEHSVFVEQLFFQLNPRIDAKWRLAALLHDAPEYVIGDMISPVKSAVGPGYREMDDRLTAAIHLKFGLPTKIPDVIKKQIKRADMLSAWLEAVQIAGFSANEANQLFGDPILSDLPQTTLRPHAPMQVKGQFLEVFNDLMEKI
jgi:5'-deoxynucleotidase YfbR-like HD superfamily hydrolase